MEERKRWEKRKQNRLFVMLCMRDKCHTKERGNCRKTKFLVSVHKRLSCLFHSWHLRYHPPLQKKNTSYAFRPRGQKSPPFTPLKNCCQNTKTLNAKNASACSHTKLSDQLFGRSDIVYVPFSGPSTLPSPSSG